VTKMSYNTSGDGESGGDDRRPKLPGERKGKTPSLPGAHQGLGM